MEKYEESPSKEKMDELNQKLEENALGDNPDKKTEIQMILEIKSLQEQLAEMKLDADAEQYNLSEQIQSFQEQLRACREFLQTCKDTEESRALFKILTKTKE